jgi:hypothetical protein
MKHFIAALASVLGLSTTAASEVKLVDPKSILFSLPTINDSLPVTDPGLKPREGDLVIHEDDWRQFEAISVLCDAAMREEIAGVQFIYHEKSHISGGYRAFREIHIRKLVDHPLPKPLAWTGLLSAAGIRSSAVFGLGLRDGQGMVRDGFAFQIGQLTIFGIRRGENVEILCFTLTRAPGLGEDDAKRIATYLDKNGVVMVHWPSATIITGEQSMEVYLRQKSS